MLLNPNRVQLQTIPGTRILEETFGLVGFHHVDPREPRRSWVLQCLYAPIKRRRLNGIRAKFMDTKGFVSFCNQRDLEVILGIAYPGSVCLWADMDYEEVGDPGWFGFCMDEEDLMDDLLERELRLRGGQPGTLAQGLQIERRLHNAGSDVQELHLLIGDYDPVTYISPDPRLETVCKRWVRVERVPLVWEMTDM